MTTAVQQLLGDLKAIAEHLGELVSSLDPPATGDLKNDLSHLRTLSAEAVLALEQVFSFVVMIVCYAALVSCLGHIKQRSIASIIQQPRAWRALHSHQDAY